MDFTVFIFLTSGLFLGWSLGANDAANVFGTAVGTRMVQFTTAAIVCSIFVILGSVLSGAGAAHTLGKLGSINALAGSFMAALAAAITVYVMTKLELPVSTSQAIVGAIIGWNLFSGSVTDASALGKILFTWVACPVLAAIIAAPLYVATQRLLARANLHILRRDIYTRIALIIAGAFGSYSLGANNIANVMGVFVPASPFTDFSVAGAFTVTGIQQLFLLGAIAIAVGVFTYSKRVMMTVGGGLMPLSPVAAWVIVIAHSIVLTLFASEGLEYFLASNGLPTIPLRSGFQFASRGRSRNRYWAFKGWQECQMAGARQHFHGLGYHAADLRHIVFYRPVFSAKRIQAKRSTPRFITRFLRKS